MANEFTRTESVSDYQNYAGREGSQIDFTKEAAKIATGAKAIADTREKRKKDIQTEEDNVINQLEQANSFQNQTLGQTVLLSAKNLKETLLMQSKLMKAGKIKPADFMASLQTAKDDIANWGIAAKDWNSKYEESQKRQQLDPTTNKVVASGMETAIKESTLAFNNLNDVVPWTSATGNSYLVRMNVDEDGNATMPDFETEREKYLGMSSMNDLLLYQDDNAKYDISSLIAGEKKNVGAFITSTISGYTVDDGGNIVVTREGAREMEDALKNKSGQTDFLKLVDTITSTILYDDLSMANVLVNRSSGDDRYIIAQTAQEFADKGGTDLKNWLQADYTTQPPSVVLSEEQKSATKSYVRDEILTQFGQKTEKTKGLTGQQPNAAGTTTKKLDTKVGGYAAQLADVLVGDPANAENIIRSLITDINNNKSDTNASDIVDFDINEDTIVFYKDGEDPISVPRRSATGEIDNPDTPDINEAYDDVDILNEITGLYKSLTGESANRSEIEAGLAEVNYDLTGKTKRKGRLSGGTPRSAFDLITENQKVNADGDTILSLLDDAFGDTTMGVVDFLKGDKGAENSINEVIQKSLRSGVKKNITRSKLGNAKTKLFSDAQADSVLQLYIKGLNEKDPTGKLAEDFKEGAFSNRSLGDEVVMIEIAGTKTPILLDQSLSKEKIAASITEAINLAVVAVNKERESTDAKRAKGGRPSVNMIQKKNPQKTGESAVMYKARIMKMWKDKVST
tara:strand:- start:2020 stop:4239 length:2220 start_codon:yes stop_codon:yes gene_type:complete